MKLEQVGLAGAVRAAEAGESLLPYSSPRSATPDPSTQTAGAEGAPDVHIEPRLKRHFSERADTQVVAPAAGEDQGVGAGGSLI